MTIQRIPTSQGARTMAANLQATYGRLADLQDQLSSGRTLRRPSDAPARVVESLGVRGEIRRSAQLERNAGDAQAWLDTADSALMEAVGYLQRARDLALQGANGSQNATGRAALAAEIRSLRDGLVELANTTHQGRPIFNGTAEAATQPYGAGLVYQGNAGVVSRAVSVGASVTVNVTGPEVFGADAGTASYGGNAFEVLTRLADDLDANDVSGMAPALRAVDTTLERVYTVQATLGARSRRLADVVARNEDRSLELEARRADLEDIDLPRTIIDVKTQEMAYQAALSATARVIQPSLLDFLR